MRYPLQALVALACERCAALAHPPSGEPCPISIHGATVSQWTRLAGIGTSSPHPCIGDLFEAPQPCGEHHPDTVTHQALQRLTKRSLTERAPNPAREMRYRPVVRHASR